MHHRVFKVLAVLFVILYINGLTRDILINTVSLV